MITTDQTAIILYTMQSLKREGSWCGETHVQKAIYLCQEAIGIPSNFKFILYKHGPYSFELSGHLQGLIADDLISVLPRFPYGPTLSVTDEGQLLADKVTHNAELSQHIAFMSKKLGRKDVVDLEKLATAVYVSRKYGSKTPIEKRAEILTSLKPHVSVEAARIAFEEAEAIEDEAHRTVM
jgi:uncharacterized protein YwgA